MEFLFEFISFSEFELVTIFNSLFSFFNTGVLTLFRNVFAIFPGIRRLLNDVIRLFPSINLPLWKFLLYDFGTLLILSFLARIWDALPFL